MNTQTKPISEINHLATRILFEKLGVADTLRFLNQFSMGKGDYTKDREKWLDDISLGEAILHIKSERTPAGQRRS